MLLYQIFAVSLPPNQIAKAMKQQFLYHIMVAMLAMVSNVFPAFPQKNASANSADWQKYLSELSGMEEFEGVNWEDYEETLAEYAEHPLNLNQATREDLSRLPFLSSQQVEDIQSYVYRYGGMKSLAEIAMISSINAYQRKLLGCFCYVETVEKRKFPSFQTVMQNGKHELMGMLQVPFYQRQGDKQGYFGEPYKHWLRYQYRLGNYVKMGFLGAQDAGEPFFSGKNRWGYDFYTFYLQVRKWGRVKNLTLGRYRLHFGQGLILNNDFSFGKTTLLTNLGANSNSIRAHSSRSAANYLQGAAATVTVAKGLDASGFISYRTIDATLNDSGGIATIVKTGLHRTQSELDKQGVATQLLVGGNLNYFHNGFHVGGTAFHTSFSRPLQPKKSVLYKRYAAEGKEFWNVSIDYGYISHRLAFAGEVATGDCHALATSHGVSYLFSDKFSLMGLYRFYGYQYYSLFSNGFSDGSDTQDEQGAYLGGNWSPNQQWSFLFYTDFAYFIWPKYGTRQSTSSWDNLLQIHYTPSDQTTWTARYRYKDKQDTQIHRARLTFDNQAMRWNVRLQADFSYVQDESQHVGWMGSGKLGYQGNVLRCTVQLGYFHTDDYQSRVYAYEPGLLYSLGFANYYGEGIRYAFVLRADIGKHLVGIGKLGVTDYFDRNHISSGLQQINHSSKTDLELQLKWRF